MGTAPETMPYPGYVLERLNRLSLTRSFTPQVDVDWRQITTEDEFRELYPAWSLLAGTGADARLDERGRAAFARYQQANLMMFTGMLERYAVIGLAGAYELDPSEEFSEYVGHFMKEEIYHTMMFRRAMERLHAGLPAGLPHLPTSGLKRLLKIIFGVVNAMPSRKLRATLTFRILRFVEQVTIYANQMAQSRIARRESLVRQIWSYHALDEGRHLVFDAMILERNRLPKWLDWAPRTFAVLCCMALSLLLNAQEIWMGRQLGLKLVYWQLPGLMRRTQAPFKQRAFGLVARALKGETEVGE